MDVNNNKGAIKKVVRRFKNSWLDEDIFKGWLAPHPENKAFCNICNTTIRCCKADLIRHSQTTKHIQEFNLKSQSLDCCNKNNDNNDNVLHIDKVKRAEIKLAAFFAEHNVAFYSADHLIPLLKNIFDDSRIVQDLAMARKKCTNLVKNVIALRETEKIVDILQTRKFSILIDESTDISDIKIMCVLVQFLSKENEIKTQLLDLIALKATDCSAKNLFQSFKELLNNEKIPINNIIGMASDNASVMIGCKNSFFSRLQSEVPNVIMLNCICHSSAIIASKACEKLPETCENLIRNVATYISGSAKRCAILTEFQEFFDVEKRKILKLSNTRWLILHNCVIRILDNWEVLKHFFILAVNEDKLRSAEIILDQLNNNSTKAYLLFLKYSLNFFNTFNALFQSRKVLIHKLFNTSQQIIQQIGQNFIIPEALKDIVDLNIDNENMLQHVNDVYVGPECENFLVTLSDDCVQEIKLKCLDFYKTAVREMLKRLPYRDIFFKQLAFLDPKIALFDEGRNEIRDLTYVATRIEHIDLTKLAFEWRILPSVFNNIEKEQLALLEINKMWKKITQHRDFNGDKIFINLELLVEAVFSLPHSNAEAERIFSIISDIKTKKRNRLSVETMSAICIARSSFQVAGINCVNFEVDSRHLELYDAQKQSSNDTENFSN